MTDDLKAPERIWVGEDAIQMGDEGAHVTFDPEATHLEYVRADRIATLEAALADMTRQRDAAMAQVVLTNDGVQAQLAEGIGAILRKFCDSDHASRARHHLHEMPKRDWDTLITMLADAVVSIPANALAAISRIEAQAEVRGWNNAMLTAITHVAEIRNAHTPGPIFKALNEAMGKIDDARFAGLRRYQTDATEAAAKGGV